jgi:hypothetical protein
VATKRSSIYCSIEQVHEVPKTLSARIIVELYPRTGIGLASLLQGQGDVAKRALAAGIEEVRFGGCKRIISNFHRIAIRVYLRAEGKKPQASTSGGTADLR